MLKRITALVLTTLLLLSLFCTAGEVYAKPRKKIRKPSRISKNLGQEARSLDLNIYDFTLAETVTNIIEDSANTDLYDQLTLNNLQRLKEEAQPPWNPADIDPYKTRQVVEKALAIQSGRSIIKLLNQSELRSSYLAFKRYLNSIRKALSFSLQDSGDRYLISREKKGKQLIELNMEFNLRNGLDPQLNLGNSLRFRYNYLEKRPVLELGFDF
ncbi:MAG: hypothetical protein D6719_12690 [Candidatus Dadabacteria bacterium]|nr:MAG: hypothetical protein D6719_12690 [Candidatus Dadabacteria bacterium]